MAKKIREERQNAPQIKYEGKIIFTKELAENKDTP